MPETYAQQLERLKKELKHQIAVRNTYRPGDSWYHELTKDIADTRAVIQQLEQAIREGHA